MPSRSSSKSWPANGSSLSPRLRCWGLGGYSWLRQRAGAAVETAAGATTSGSHCSNAATGAGCRLRGRALKHGVTGDIRQQVIEIEGDRLIRRKSVRQRGVRLHGSFRGGSNQIERLDLKGRALQQRAAPQEPPAPPLPHGDRVRLESPERLRLRIPRQHQRRPALQRVRAEQQAPAAARKQQLLRPEQRLRPAFQLTAHGEPRGSLRAEA